MELINKEKVIFRKDFNNKASYSTSVSKKKQDGSYENGYIPIAFRKDTHLKDRTKIKILDGWWDFFTINKKTIVYFFINKFELASDMDAMKQVSDNFDKVEELPFY